MALDKKTVIQLAVLVVLGGAAAAYFLLPDSGALVDSVVGMFEDKPAATTAKKAPAIKRRGEDASAPAAAPAKPKRAAAPVIPNEPVKGMVSGKPFSLERAYVQNGVLVLLSGKDPATAGVSIHGLSKAWDVPAGKNVKVAADTKADSAPGVRVSWKDDADGAPQSREFKDHYTLQLELGAEEKDGKIPGKLLLTLPDDQKSTVAGTFNAEVRGFRIVNGKPDLSADATDTLEYLTLQELLKGDPGRNIADVTFHDQRLAGSGDAMTGYLEVRYRAGDAAPTAERYQFMKAQGEWKVRGQLKLTQIDEAHPVKAPGAKAPYAELFPYLAARRLEAELAKRSPKKGVYDVGFESRIADKYKIGQCEVSYRLEGAAEPTKVSYLLRNKAKGWQIERALRANEKINFDNGRIEVAKAAKKK